MDLNGTTQNVWMQATPFVPAGSFTPQGSSTLPPFDTYTSGIKSGSASQEDLAFQLRFEQEQHALTKRLLQSEQGKVQQVEAKLDEVRRENSSLVAVNRLHAEVVHKAVHRIEPKLDKLVETADLLTAPCDANCVGACDMKQKNDPVDLLGGIAQEVETSDSHKAMHEHSALSLTDPRPSILYDILEYQNANHIDITSNMHSVDQKHAERVSESECIHDHANGIVDNDQRLTHQSVGQCAHQIHKEEDTWFGLDQFDKPGPALGEYSSLEEVFRNGNLHKPMTDPEPSRHMSEKEISEDTLIDFLPGTGRSPKSKGVNEGFAGTDRFNPGQTQTRGKDIQFPPSKTGVNEKAGVTSVEPVLGVEQRIISTRTVQNDNTPCKEARTLASLPTLRLPSSFLSQAVNYKSFSDPSDSTSSTDSDKLQSSELEPTKMPHVPAYRRAQAQKNAQALGMPVVMPPATSKKRVYLPDDVAAHIAHIVPESIASDKTDENGRSDTPKSNHADSASTPQIRPSSGAGDNYNVIPVSMMNYLQPIDWKIGRDQKPLFQSELEKENFQRRGDQQGQRHSEFWVHSVRYEPPVDEPNALRTVQIDHIPRNVEVQEVLRELCWGVIESIQLVDIGNVRGTEGLTPAPFKFARVVFIMADCAAQFARYAHNKSLTIGGQPVRVYVQMEPTYPRTAEVGAAIFDKGMTRILSVFGLTEEARAQLPTFLKQHGLDLVYCDLRSHDTSVQGTHMFTTKVVMEFRSILHALRAFEAMEDGGFKSAAAFMIETDYCARAA
ncbi:hypothetical protein EPUS_04841 [Endocarpon pusillum Z07020]|uniref:Uncharacterized protein n=1 Tax=Endocarpon pusillum (strain Z07020 / HMAS-L-300199) TaxID=1263415 RepID=U1HZR1_ENDPU|nr:uncharacterized protein EPUS_04841 [Endocarpon pusillum Z07020]ERF75059.1 hypothetical protein EPUS_04841 [Endocarpon pusillum Z07020]